MTLQIVEDYKNLKKWYCKVNLEYEEYRRKTNKEIRALKRTNEKLNDKLEKIKIILEK